MNPAPRSSYVSTNGIRLHVAEAGPAGGPPVILLHGFPESWYGWRHQFGPLAEAGYRVVVPDQRGYNLSDKPAGVAAYALDTLAADVLGLIDVLGTSRARLVGHDWGGIVAWWVATRHPDRVDRLAILNAPHPSVFRRRLLVDPAQLLRSWYVFTFQLPRLPEARLRRSNWKALAHALRASSRPGTFSDEDLACYRQAWSQPGAITSMIHWYRAALRYPAKAKDPAVTVPTLLIHGVRDRFLGPNVLLASLQLCRDARYERFEDATHWVQHEEADRVNRMLLDFLRSA
jgi:epoxide hydrolase 4